MMQGSANPVHPRSREVIGELFTGFDLLEPDLVATNAWDVLIIGRSVADAVDPSSAATRIVELAQHRRERHV